jgi:hypothetical protein
MTVGDTLSITPENILSNTATLMFQRSGAENENVITLSFTSVSGIAKVSTAPLNDLSAFAGLPGAARTAVQSGFAPILGATPVTFTADLALTAGTNYFGNGSDLLVLQSIGTNWNLRSFSYIATNHQVSVAGVTNLSAFVVAQFAPPTLTLNATGASRNISFAPLAGLVHTLERSTNLVHWTPLNSFTASDASPVALVDSAAPVNKAFYRVKVNRP